MTSTTPKMKRPGAAATASEPMSSNPHRGKAMNSQEHITAPADPAIAPPSDRQRNSAMMGLEGPIRELWQMALIMVETVRETVTEPAERDGESFMLLLQGDELDMIAFVTTDIVRRARKLDRAFQDAWQGKEIAE